MTVVAVHQPNYLPWLGWFAKACAADVFVLLDDVQFTKGGYTNRVRVKGPSGAQWLTVPVRTRGRSRQDVRDVETDPTGDWAERHVKTLEQAYGRTPGWDGLGQRVTETLLAAPTLLAPLNEALARLVLDALAIEVRIVRASELGGPREPGHRGLIEICRRLGAATYLSGEGAAAYQTEADFGAAGIALRYSSFRHPEYPQQHGDFVAGLSAVDLLFNRPDDADRLLREAVAAGAGE